MPTVPTLSSSNNLIYSRNLRDRRAPRPHTTRKNMTLLDRRARSQRRRPQNTMLATLAFTSASVLKAPLALRGGNSLLPRVDGSTPDPTTGVDLVSFLLPKDVLKQRKLSVPIENALQVNLWDCSGRSEFADVRAEFIREAHCCCL